MTSSPISDVAKLDVMSQRIPIHVASKFPVDVAVMGLLSSLAREAAVAGIKLVVER
jgi:hypothetical protein